MMRRLHVLNPNSSAAMTEAVVSQVRCHLPPGFSVVGHTAADGPPVIDSRIRFDRAAQAMPGMARVGDAHDALLLACFGDPGLEALRAAAAPRMVAGLAEAAVAQAVAARQRFAILTAGPGWVAMLGERIADFGAAAWLSGVYALPVNGRQLSADPEACRNALGAAARAAEGDGAQVLMLGGAAFAGLAGLVESKLPLIDPIAAATAQLTRA